MFDGDRGFRRASTRPAEAMGGIRSDDQPWEEDTNVALDKVEGVKPKVLAYHPVSVLSGKIPAYIRALRQNDVIGLTDWNPMKERSY